MTQTTQVSIVMAATIGTTLEDRLLIGKIAKRAEIELGMDSIAVSMDLTVAHFNSPLDLQAINECKDGNFAHDIFGINTNLDHETGKFYRFFEPRFAKRNPIGSTIQCLVVQGLNSIPSKLGQDFEDMESTEFVKQVTDAAREWAATCRK